MGKKGKKGKKGSGKKKKGGKKKKSTEPEMTWKEALLAYKINIQERYLEDYKYELRALEDKNMRHKERNERLMNEQNTYMRMLLKQAREYEKKLAAEDVITKTEVTDVMFTNWQAERDEEKDIAILKEQIARMETTILSEVRQREYWEAYRDKGQHSHKKQIELLEQELVDMKNNYDEITAHLHRTLDKEIGIIEKHTEETLDNQKYLATEKAIAKMDKYSAQEAIDNEWLKMEVEIHQNEASLLLIEVEKLEKECLDIMSELFDCTVEDLKISRSLFLTQFADNENLDETGILEIDLSKVALYDEETKTYRPTKLDELEKYEADQHLRAARPKSATQKYIEDKVFSLDKFGKKKPSVIEEESVDDDVDTESKYDGENDDGVDDPFNNYYTFDDEDFEDYLQLGPLQLKLLNVEGRRMEILPATNLTAEELHATLFKPDTWPVTARMINTGK